MRSFMTITVATAGGTVVEAVYMQRPGKSFAGQSMTMRKDETIQSSELKRNKQASSCSFQRLPLEHQHTGTATYSDQDTYNHQDHAAKLSKAEQEVFHKSVQRGLTIVYYLNIIQIEIWNYNFIVGRNGTLTPNLIYQ